MDKESVRKLALSSMLAALEVVLLYFSSLFEMLDLTIAAATVFVSMFAVAEIKGSYPVGIYLTVSVLSLLLLPKKFSASVYTMFLGWYPMLKSFTEKHMKRLGSWLVKLICFNVSFTLILAVCKFILGLEDLGGLDPKIGYAVLYVMGNGTFLLFDIVLTWVNTLYILRLRKRMRIDRLFK